MAGRDPRRALAVLGVACVVLAVVAAFAYVFWGWLAFLSGPNGRFPEMEAAIPWGPAEYAAAREEAARYARWARAFRFAAVALAGVALGCAATLGWRARRAWGEWPWPSLVCFVPALLALALTLVGATKGIALAIALGVEVASLFAAFFDLSRREAGSPSRPLSWTVLVASLLAILIRPLLPWH